MSIKEYYNLDKKSIFLVGQKAVIIKNSKLLILRGSYGEKFWQLPGGLLEFGEDLINGLCREVKEETGLKLKIKSLLAAETRMRPEPFIFKDGRKLKTQIVNTYYLGTVSNSKIKLSWEHEEYMWADYKTIKKLPFYGNTKKIIMAYKSKIFSAKGGSAPGGKN